MRIFAILYATAIYFVVADILLHLGISEATSSCIGFASALVSGFVLFFINGALGGNKIEEQ